MSRTKVLVLGAGPAGAAAAAFLALRELEVVVVDRGARPRPGALPKIGESLPPDARALLEQLGVWPRFEAGPHLPCYGNKSYWGSPRPRYHDFLRHPLGHGWHIDRRVFEEMLVRRAADLGATVSFETGVLRADYRDGRWNVLLDRGDGRGREADFGLLVDATGRSAWLARRQGAERLYEDRQVALVAFLATRGEVEDTATLVETAEPGWWYSAPIPGARMATAFFCGPEEAERQRWLEEGGWRELLSRAPRTAERVEGADGRLLAPPRFVAADSGILERVYGPGWIAVGDAALTYDPVASHGIVMAMVSARDAARALGRHLEGDDEALPGYEAVLWAAFQRYARERQALLG